MSFLEKVKDFFLLLKEANYDLEIVYSQNPNGVYLTFLILLIIIVVVVYLVNNILKKNRLLEDISNIQKSSDFIKFNEKLSKIAIELPKRGEKIAQKLNILKNEISEKGIFLIDNSDLKEKIENYKKLSSNYLLISNNSKKYNIEELTLFFDEESKRVLEENLFKDIEKYCKSCRFQEKDIENINAIISYANNSSNSFELLNLFEKEINKFSFSFNLEIFKFIKKLNKNLSGELFIKLNKKIDFMLNDEYSKISETLIKYLLQTDEKEKIYNYVSKLKDSVYLQSLYYNFFGKSEDIDLDLAFIKNETKIENEYKEYLDKKITLNWKDSKYIKHILNAPRVLENIGHFDYRNILERLEKLEKEVDFNETVSKILEVARNAEKVAKEAKAIARGK